MSELISVIVPIYNKENTIVRCVDSIINQTYSNIEILLIDDGSNDSTPTICEMLQKKDPRIRVFTEMNSGPSSARNYGINKANGQYLIFADADDYLENNMIEVLYENLVHYSADIVLCGYKTVDINGIEVSRTFENNGYCDEKRLLKMLRKWNISPLVGAPWNKLYRRSIIFDHNIRFPVAQTWAEDLQFNLFVFNANPTIYVIESCLYNYVIGGISLTSENNSSKSKLLKMAPAIKGLCNSYCELYGDKRSVELQHVILMLYRFALRLSARTLDLKTYYSFVRSLGEDNYLSKEVVYSSNEFSFLDKFLCWSYSNSLFLPLVMIQFVRARMIRMLKKIIKKR